MDIIRKYEDVLQDKVKEKKTKKNKTKREPYSLSSRHHNVSKQTTDPYEKYISFYPSKTEQSEMFDARYAKR